MTCAASSDGLAAAAPDARGGAAKDRAASDRTSGSELERGSGRRPGMRCCPAPPDAEVAADSRAARRAASTEQR